MQVRRRSYAREPTVVPQSVAIVYAAPWACDALVSQLAITTPMPCTGGAAAHPCVANDAWCYLTKWWRDEHTVLEEECTSPAFLHEVFV